MVTKCSGSVQIASGHFQPDGCKTFVLLSYLCLEQKLAILFFINVYLFHSIHLIFLQFYYTLPTKVDNTNAKK